jgi:hypothetical protein
VNVEIYPASLTECLSRYKKEIITPCDPVLPKYLEEAFGYLIPKKVKVGDPDRSAKLASWQRFLEVALPWETNIRLNGCYRCAEEYLLKAFESGTGETRISSMSSDPSYQTCIQASSAAIVGPKCTKSEMNRVLSLMLSHDFEADYKANTGNSFAPMNTFWSQQVQAGALALSEMNLPCIDCASKKFAALFTIAAKSGVECVVSNPPIQCGDAVSGVKNANDAYEACFAVKVDTESATGVRSPFLAILVVPIFTLAL